MIKLFLTFLIPMRKYAKDPEQFKPSDHVLYQAFLFPAVYHNVAGIGLQGFMLMIVERTYPQVSPFISATSLKSFINSMVTTLRNAD